MNSNTTPASPSLHICIATGQNLPNLIGALQLKATAVWILRTKSMHSSAVNLQRALKTHDIETRVIDFDDADPMTLDAESGRVAEAADGSGLPITVNVTGGTKQMTISLTQTLVRHLDTGTPPRVIYVDTNRRRIDTLGQPGGTEPLVNVLRLSDVLAVQGYTEIQTESAEMRARAEVQATDVHTELTKLLLSRTGATPSNQEAGWLAILNHISNSALSRNGLTLSQPRQEIRVPQRGPLSEILALAASTGLIEWQPGDAVLTFRSADAARYLGGGWAEEATTDIARRTLARSAEVRTNVTIEHISTGVRNEADVLVLRDNRVLVIECKTALGKEEKPADWMYKLHKLANDIGGSMAGAMIVSAQPIETHHHDRAEKDRVKLLDGPRIKNLSKYLQAWPDEPALA